MASGGKRFVSALRRLQASRRGDHHALHKLYSLVVIKGQEFAAFDVVIEDNNLSPLTRCSLHRSHLPPIRSSERIAVVHTSVHVALAVAHLLNVFAYAKSWLWNF